MAGKISVRTRLAVGGLSVPVGLVKASGSPEGSSDLPPVERALADGSPVRSERRATASGSSSATAARVQTDAFGFTREPVPPAMTGAAPAEEVAEEEIRRGVRRDDGSFLDLTDDLAAIADATRLEEMRVDSFVAVSNIPRERITGSYFLVPDGANSPRVLNVLYEAMGAEGRAAVVKLTKKSVQSLAVLVPRRDGAILVLDVEWSARARRPGARELAHRSADVGVEEVAAARELVRAMGGRRVDLDGMEDDRARMTCELIEARLSGRAYGVPGRPEVVEDLGDVEAALVREAARAREADAA